MDLDEWESLSDDCYLDFNEDGDEKKILGSSSESVIDMNYFYPKSPKKQLIPLQIPIEPTKISNTPDDFSMKNIKKIQPLATPSSKDGVVVEADQEETVSQVYFKMKENEFVEMKIESPKSNSSEGREIMSSPRRKIEKEEEEESNWEEEENNSGFNIWKWSFTGFGAICTFGVAAASISVLFFGGQQRKNLNHKIGFQIYTDDKVS